MRTLNQGKGWSRFWQVARPFFVSEMRWPALGMLGLLIALLLGLSGLNVTNSYVGRDFMSAIAERDTQRYYILALLYAGVFVASTVVAVFERYTEERLGLMWRRWLTTYLLDRYLKENTFYRLNARQDIDNPDQRISEDIKNFTTTTLSFIIMILNSIITVCAFLGILWSITPWLFFVAVLYSMIGSLMAVLLGHRLVGLNNLQFRREADFRYELIHVREHAESIALVHDEQFQMSRLLQRLGALVDNFKAIISVERNLGFFTSWYNYIIQLIPLLITAPLYFEGTIEFGVVTQSAMAFAQVVGAFSLVVVQFQSISTFAAVIARLGTLWDAISETISTTRRVIPVVEDNRRVKYERLTLRTPKEGRELIKELTLELPFGKRLLIHGPNGAGKSALMRAAAGLWDSGQGRIVRPARDEVVFLPQKPYLVPGSLRDQLQFPNRKRALSEKRIVDVLGQVQLESMVERIGGMDVEADWTNILSMSEQQLLAIARLLLANPRFAFLDEATKSLGMDRDMQIYQVLSRTSITYLSVSDHLALREYHDLLLELHHDGNWTVQPAELVAAY